MFSTHLLFFAIIHKALLSLGLCDNNAHPDDNTIVVILTVGDLKC